MNVAEYLVRAAALYPRRPAVAVGTAILYDYQALRQRVEAAAALLRARGVRRNDRIFLFLENRVEYLEMLLAVWWVGASVVPLNIKLHANELAYIWRHSGAALGIISRKTEGTALAAAKIGGVEANCIVVDEQHIKTAELPTSPEPMSPNDPAWLFYTSGTTGKPKGAVLSHGGLRFTSLNVRSDLDLGMHEDTLFHAAPMSHGSGLCVLAYIIGGACHVIPESGGFDPEEVLSLIRVHRNCCIFAPPTLVHRMNNSSVEAPVANIKTILYGGGPMHLSTLTAALERFGPTLLQLYAQGECPMTISVLPKWAHADRDNPRYLDRLSSVGLPCTGADVRIFDSENRPLRHGEVGEIAVKSPAVMLGYLSDPDATAEAIVDGWLRTGDVGTFDADGFLFLKDRLKEMIISGGTNIYTKEVEDVILQHPLVSEVAVVAKQDGDWGEIPVAFVVASAAGQLNLAELDRHCLQNLSRFKRPKFYKIVQSLPANGSGKILKRNLRDRISDDPGFTFDYAVGERPA